MIFSYQFSSEEGYECSFRTQKLHKKFEPCEGRGAREGSIQAFHTHESSTFTYEAGAWHLTQVWVRSHPSLLHFPLFKHTCRSAAFLPLLPPHLGAQGDSAAENLPDLTITSIISYLGWPDAVSGSSSAPIQRVLDVSPSLPGGCAQIAALLTSRRFMDCGKGLTGFGQVICEQVCSDGVL